MGFESLTPQARVNNVSTDSRNIKRGDLFIALRGEKFDGHGFLDVAKKSGAVAAVVDNLWFTSNVRKAPKGLSLIVVKDTLHTYGDLANIYRNKFSIPILLVAGSNGKTTMKDVMSHVLGTSFNVLKTEANYNNHIGLPRMLFLLRPEHEIAIFEIGTNHPGEIERLTEIAQPTHGIITNIGREHLEFFKNVMGVAKEELTLFHYLKDHEGFAFINLDDKFSKLKAKSFGTNGITFGTRKKASVYAVSKGLTTDGKQSIDLVINKKKINFKTAIIADYAPSLIAGVASVANHFGVRPTNIKQSFESYIPHSKRMEMVKFANGVLVINDAYNANPESFAAAMQTLKQLPSKGKKYLVAGDMFELGTRSAEEHKALGKLMAKHKFDGYYFSGNAMKRAFAELLKATKTNATYADSKDDIARSLKEIIRNGDVILIKGSRGMRMEEVLEKLRIEN